MIDVDTEYGPLGLGLELAQLDDVDEGADVAPAFAVVCEGLGRCEIPESGVFAWELQDVRYLYDMLHTSCFTSTLISRSEIANVLPKRTLVKRSRQ